MHTDTDQQVPYFGTPQNFAQTIKVRKLRRRVADTHTAELVACYYVQMRDLAKQGTTFATFTTDVESFVESYGGQAPKRTDTDHGQWLEHAVTLWRAFADVRLVDIDGDIADPDGTFRVHVRDLHETNVQRPHGRGRMTDEQRRARDAERKRLERAAKKTPANADNVRAASEMSVDASASALQTNKTDRQTNKTDNNPQAPTDTPAVDSIDPAGIVVELPAHPNTARGQIRRAQTRLGDVAFYVTELIARRNAAADRQLTPDRELATYWRPALELHADHGRDALLDAITTTISQNGASIQYVKTILGSRVTAAARRQADNPDLTTGSEWANVQPVRVTTTGADK